MAATTVRMALTYPQPADSNNVPGDIQRIAQQLDLLCVTFLRDVAANRPDSIGPAGVPAQGNYSPGTQGRWFWATDTKTLSYDFGGGWITMTSALQLVQTKGDLVVGTGPGAMARHGVGGDGQALISRSGAQDGLNWENVLGLPLGLAGAATPTRFVGATTTNGPPSSGTFQAGDVVINPNGGRIWICRVAGTPGTWIEVGSQVPLFNAYQGGQLISNYYYYNLSGWASAGVDTHGAITSAGYVIPKPGYWHFDYNPLWPTNQYGLRFARLTRNGDPAGGSGSPGFCNTVVQNNPTNDGPCSCQGSVDYPMYLNTGDLMAVQVSQDSGGSLRTLSGAVDAGSMFSGHWIRS